MPNMGERNKRPTSRIRGSGGRRSKRADSVKDLLARAAPALTRLTDQTARQAFWRNWLEAHLPADFVRRLSGVVERDGTLVIFAESAAWSARLRYAIQELEPEIRACQPGIAQVTVRVLPRS